MQVNFIAEVTGFYRLTKRQHLTMNAQMLWFHLFCLWNEAGFPEWLQVDMLRMMTMIQVKSKNTAIRARDELIEAGLLICKNGGNKQPNHYRLVSVKSRGSKNETQTELQTEPQIEPQTGHLYKQDHTKPKVKKEKAVFGAYGNVWLSREELLKLQQDFPDDWEEWISRLDVGKELKGYRYENDYAAIKSWWQKDEQDARDKAFAELMEECALIFDDGGQLDVKGLKNKNVEEKNDTGIIYGKQQ